MTKLYKMLDSEGSEIYVRQEHISYVLLYEGFTELKADEPYVTLYDFQPPDYSMYMKE